MAGNRGMQRRAVIAAGVGLLAQGCIATPKLAFNYRLRMTIMADGEEHSAESVIRLEIENASREFMNYGNAFRYRAQGEAPVIDFGADRPLLFALLDDIPNDASQDHFSCTSTPLSALSNANLAKSYEERWAAWKDLPKHRAAVALSDRDVPLLVRFEDISDPASVAEVGIDDLADRYGATIGKVSLQITDNPPVERIRKVLPWLVDYQPSLGGEAGAWTERTFAQKLGYGHFRRWPGDYPEQARVVRERVMRSSSAQ